MIRTEIYLLQKAVKKVRINDHKEHFSLFNISNNLSFSQFTIKRGVSHNLQSHINSYERKTCNSCSMADIVQYCLPSLCLA